MLIVVSFLHEKVDIETAAWECLVHMGGIALFSGGSVPTCLPLLKSNLLGQDPTPRESRRQSHRPLDHRRRLCPVNLAGSCVSSTSLFRHCASTLDPSGPSFEAWLEMCRLSDYVRMLHKLIRQVIRYYAEETWHHQPAAG